MEQTSYPFTLIDTNREGPIDDPGILTRRPFVEVDLSFKADARRFVPGDELESAINTAIAVGQPLLITGEPGTGKTQAAYYTAYKLGVEPVIPFQVKSDSVARDLLYYFDSVRYFHDAHLAKEKGSLRKEEYVEERALWEAFKRAREKNAPQVVLIDEIDKAPRDFPNDLLHELDKMEFTVTETGQKVPDTNDTKFHKGLKPVVIITSNSERRLPEPFLRRCVYHHIRFDDTLVEKIIASRQDLFSPLSKDFINLAVKRFLALRDTTIRKRPATGELLVWLRVLALSIGRSAQDLDENLANLPHLGVLLKDHQDMEEVRRK
jgi:MoxR-like ATPase